MRIANRDARSYVQCTRPFQGSHLYAGWKNDCYVVYSYGPHHPLFIYKNGKWYGNATKVSVTTSKHYTQACPGQGVIPLHTPHMLALLKKQTGLFGEPYYET